MLHVDIPTLPEFKALSAVRADACVSIYLQTTPLTQDAGAARTELGNLARTAGEKLEAAGLDKRRLGALMEHLDGLAEDEEFWRLQAKSLAVLATPDKLSVYRLANELHPMVEVSNRFHLKPLLRALTFPHSAFVLALSENHVRLVEVFADLPAREVRVENMPKDAASAMGKSTLNDRSHSGRIHGSEGQNVRLRQYARQVDAALRPVLAGRETPLILAATGRLESLFASVCSYPNLLGDTISDSPDRFSEADLAAAARPVLDAAYEREIDDLKQLYETRASQGRATTDMSDAARAATYGAIEALLVDIDTVIHGTVDDESGAVSFADKAGADNYGVVDEIAGRALASGARVLGVRKDDIPGGKELAAILRYAV
ncbi:MAG: baeRF11 domain-containing protein [Rhizobiaceae bacterium]